VYGIHGVTEPLLSPIHGGMFFPQLLHTIFVIGAFMW